MDECPVTGVSTWYSQQKLFALFSACVCVREHYNFKKRRYKMITDIYLISLYFSYHLDIFCKRQTTFLT